MSFQFYGFTGISFNYNKLQHWLAKFSVYIILRLCLFFQHRGIPYCNIPCYSLLFGPGGYGRGGVQSHQKVGFQATLTPDQESLR